MELMREEYSACHCKSQRLNIKLEPFNRDERTRFVENALALLVESRFGPGFVYAPAEMTFFGLPPCEVNFDLMPPGLGLLFDGISKASRSQPTIWSAAKGMADHLVHQFSPSTLARGSPSHRRTYIIP